MRFGLFLLMLLVAIPAYAADLAVTDARMNLPLAVGRPAGIFFTINNETDQAAKIMGAASPACGRLELHTHIHENGVMKMRPVDSFTVPAKGKLALGPMGDHLMCFDPKLNDQTSISVTLTSVPPVPVLVVDVPVTLSSQEKSSHHH